MSEFNPSLSFFSNARTNTPAAEEKLEDIIKLIRSTAYKSAIDAIQAASTKAERTALKKDLPAVTWAGTFSKRNLQGLIKYSGIICHDVDGLSIEQLENAWYNLLDDGEILAAFTSPSGNGLKILYRVPTGADQHDVAWQATARILKAKLGLTVDPSTKDICRLCFISHDATVIFNPKRGALAKHDLMNWASMEEVSDPPQPKTTVAAATKPPVHTVTPDYIQRAHEVVQKTVQAGPGTHNKYAGQFAQQANRYGISEDDCISELHSYMPDYNGKELVATVKHHYKKESGRHGEYTRHRSQSAAQSGTAMSQANDQGSGYDESVKFWYSTAKRNKVGEVMLNTSGEPMEDYGYSYDDAIEFLQNNGFYKHRGENNSYQFIRIDRSQKVVEIVVERQMKEYMLDFLKTKNDFEFKKVREMFRRGSKNYCSTGILEGLEYYLPKMRKDTRESAYIYFENCFLEITAQGIAQSAYNSQDNYIWAKQVKPFQFTATEAPDCDFATFLRYAITGEKLPLDAYPEAQEKLYRAACTSIGYLLHRYKDPTLTKAVITTDKALRHGTENEGRSGKSLVGKALEYMLICTPIDGRNFSFDKDFAFQKVNIDTQLINFNDIKPKFDFTRLFGMITEEFTFEKKGKDMITIPFEDAPKFYISSNSTLRGEGSSTRARQQILEFSNFFHEGHTPVMEFEHRFFSGWTKDEWNRFYNFMAHCLHLYLKEGLLEFPLENYAINALYETPGAGEELVEFLDEAVSRNIVKEHDSTQLFNSYKSATTQKIEWLKKNTFTKWVKQWATIKGLKINAHKTDGRDKRNGIDYLTFTPVDGTVQPAPAVEPGEQDRSTDISEELPF